MDPLLKIRIMFDVSCDVLECHYDFPNLTRSRNPKVMAVKDGKNIRNNQFPSYWHQIKWYPNFIKKKEKKEEKKRSKHVILTYYHSMP